MTVPQQSVTSSLVFPIDDVLEFISNFSGSFARALIAYLLTPVFAHRRLSQAYPEFCWILRCPQPSCFSRRRCFRKICRTFLEISWNFSSASIVCHHSSGFTRRLLSRILIFSKNFPTCPNRLSPFLRFFPVATLRCALATTTWRMLSRAPPSLGERI